MRKLLFLALLCPFLTAFGPMELQAQTAIQQTAAGEFDTKKPSPPLQPLSIGDPVPDILLQNLLNHPATTAKLSSFKQRLIILDFWAVWCSACLHCFPKLDSLQQRFGDSLAVILITEDSKSIDTKKISVFFQKHTSPSGKPYRFPVLLGETVLASLFPHNLIPHFVWILDNRVAAITSGAELTAANVHSFLTGHAPRIRTKAEMIGFNPHKPFFENGVGSVSPKIRMRSLFTAYLDGLGAGTFINRDSTGKITRLCLINTSILNLFKYAWKASGATVKINARDSLKLANPDNWEEWKYENAWTYELICQPSSITQVLQHMRVDLVQFFGYQATLENRSGQLPLFTIFENSH